MDKISVLMLDKPWQFIHGFFAAVDVHHFFFNKSYILGLKAIMVQKRSENFLLNDTNNDFFPTGSVILT